MASQRITARSLTPADLSDAVVVSFSAHWLKKLKAKEFSAVIRKRVPESMTPAWLYFYINSPVSAICARAHVRSLEKLCFQKAVSISDKLALSKEEIKNYMGNNKDIGAYFITEIDLSEPTVSLLRLKEVMIYQPPQSFFMLSVRGKRIVDQLCQFALENDD